MSMMTSLGPTLLQHIELQAAIPMPHKLKANSAEVGNQAQRRSPLRLLKVFSSTPTSSIVFASDAAAAPYRTSLLPTSTPHAVRDLLGLYGLQRERRHKEAATDGGRKQT